MSEVFQQYDPNTGAFNSTDLYTCRVIVPYAHKLKSASLFTQNIVTTGTVTVSLKQTDPGDGRGGAIVGTVLNNATLGSTTATCKKIDFTLASADKETAPKNRMYYLVFTGTDAADRVDEPVLSLEVDAV